MKNLKTVCFSFLFIIVALCACLFVCPIDSVSAESLSLSGKGTSAEPYLIQTVDDLEFFRTAVNNGVPAETGKIEYASAVYSLQNSLNLEGIDWTPIGTNTNPFMGTFKGDGKSITNIKISQHYSEIGLFGYIKGATICDLGVEIEIVLKDNTIFEDGVDKNESTQETVKVGGIVGVATENSEIFASYAKVSLSADRKQRLDVEAVQEYFQAVDGSEEIVDLKTTKIYQTYKYMGEITFGGLVGQSLESSIHDCYAIPEITILQEGSNSVSSRFGGAVGAVKDGEILRVYVAPTEKFVLAIQQKNGILTAIESINMPIKINSLKSDEIVFGGIVGFAEGNNLEINNIMFASMMASFSEPKILRGGIVGKISENSTLFPKEIQYGKYLSINNGSLNVLAFQSVIGNANDVGYTINTTLSQISAMPTQSVFNSWSWNEFRPWDFEEVWKEGSIISSMGYYFPALQNFASFKISIEGSKGIVSFSITNSYLSGYYTLELEGQGNLKSYEYSAGQQVKIIAKFYSEEGNPLRDFKNYFKFTNWLFGENLIATLDYDGGSVCSSPYTVSLDPENGTTTLSFVASSQTEGKYDIKIKGNPVTLKINFIDELTDLSKSGIGSVTRKIGNEIINEEDNFTFVIDEYVNDSETQLTANNSRTGEYIFAGKWQDKNKESLKSSKSSIVIKLDNEKQKSSSTKYYYPTVVSTSEGLVAEINVYFSNNTIPLNVKISGKGGIKLNEGDLLDSNYSTYVISGKSVSFEAIPEDGFEFDGWYVGGTKVSGELNYQKDNITSEFNLEARFTEIDKDNGGLQAWAIALIVVAPITVAGVVVLVILKIKRNSRSGYKKKFKF